MTAQALQAPRFVRRTELGPGEYRKNFRQVDGDVIAAVTSREADRVTPLMSKIYLRLVNAPARYWERDGVLRFEGELSGDKRVTAWEALCEAVGVASATANKALRWMHEQGVVGYFAGKNGVGVRIFLNRASSSIGTRTAGKKILEFSRASSQGARTSSGEAAFSDSYADLEVSETDINPRAPKSGAVKPQVVKNILAAPATPPGHSPPTAEDGISQPVQAALRIEVVIDEIVSRLKYQLEPSLDTAARQAAAREHELTREWLESKGLPKAARVAQREAYNVLRQHGLIGRSSGNAAVGRGSERPELTCREARPLTADEIRELAQACVALLEVHGRSLDTTLAEMGVEAGGFLSPADAPKVRELAEAMARDGRPEGRYNESNPGSNL